MIGDKAMFTVGKKYEFQMIIGGEETTFWGSVARYEHPLLKLADTEPLNIEVVEEGTGRVIHRAITSETMPGKIINVTSQNFISAVERP
jgi:hypothetical protein